MPEEGGKTGIYSEFPINKIPARLKPYLPEKPLYKDVDMALREHFGIECIIWPIFGGKYDYDSYTLEGYDYMIGCRGMDQGLMLSYSDFNPYVWIKSVGGEQRTYSYSYEEAYIDAIEEGVDCLIQWERNNEEEIKKIEEEFNFPWPEFLVFADENSRLWNPIRKVRPGYYRRYFALKSGYSVFEVKRVGNNEFTCVDYKDSKFKWKVLNPIEEDLILTIAKKNKKFKGN